MNSNTRCYKERHCADLPHEVVIVACLSFKICCICVISACGLWYRWPFWQSKAMVQLHRQIMRRVRLRWFVSNMLLILLEAVRPFVFLCVSSGCCSRCLSTDSCTFITRSRWWSTTANGSGNVQRSCTSIFLPTVKVSHHGQQSLTAD